MVHGQFLAEPCPVAQSSDYTPAPPVVEDCFGYDWETVYEDCLPAYLRVNFHYFLDDNCAGSVYNWRDDENDIFYNEIYVHAEDLVSESNAKLGNNEAQRGYEDFYQFTRADAHYNPVRLLLSGVYVHCDSDAHESNAGLNETDYAVNEDEEINIFIRNIPTGGGSASLGSGSRMRLDRIHTGVLIHEIGHLLSLRQSWTDSNECEDLPNMRHVLDYLCDGSYVIDVNCADINVPPCEDICSEWGHISNNYMSYVGNGLRTCFTPDQMTGSGTVLGMMTNLIDNRCEQLEQIGPFGGSCKPPRAFIGQYPYAAVPIATQLHMESSVNDFEHRIKFYKQSTSGETLYTDTGWEFGPAGVYTVALENSIASYDFGFVAGIYRAELTVKNDCNQTHTHSDYFQLNNPRMVHSEVEEYFMRQLKIKYSTDRDDEIEIYSINTFSGQYNGHLQEATAKTEGEYTVEECVDDWQQGLNTILVNFQDTTHVHQIYVE